jgi:soluble lytic murein transglycosylase-like protein
MPASSNDRRQQSSPTGSAPRIERRRQPGGTDAPRRRRTDFINRYRQPILGLGLIGAAAPLARTATHARAEQEDPDAAAPTAPAPRQVQAAIATGADVEDRLAEQIAASREEEERESYVSAAVAAHGISNELAGDIFDIAREEGVDPDVALGLVRTESTFDERAVSHVGARGLTQVMPRTARGIMPGTRAEDLFDRRTNLRLGFRYLDQLVKKYRGNVELALTAYNRGPGTVDKVLKRGGDPDNGYAGKVLGG